MLESLIHVKHKAIEHFKVTKKRDKEKNMESLEIMNNKEFWNDIDKVLLFFRPLANCIAVSENEGSSLSQTIRAILDYSKSLMNINRNDEVGISAGNSFFRYFNCERIGEFEWGMLFAAYFLDRRFKMDFTTKDCQVLVLKTIGILASWSGFSNEAIHKILYEEFKSFCKQKGKFSRVARDDEHPIRWWSRIDSETSILKVVALRLAHLRASSTGIERIFSIIKLTQGLNRTRYKMDTLTSFARVKLSMVDNEWDSSIYDSIVRPQVLPSSYDPCDILIPRKVKKRDPRPIANIASSTPVPELPIESLETKNQMYLSNFKRIIDFAIINELREESDIDDNQLQPKLDLDRLVQKFINDEELNQEYLLIGED